MLNNKLTKELRDIILRKGLVDTGKMLNNSSVYLSNKNGTININIITTDYFVYLYEKYKVLDELLDSIAFSEVIVDESFFIIEDIIDEEFKGDFDLTISINNKSLGI